MGPYPNAATWIGVLALLCALGAAASRCACAEDVAAQPPRKVRIAALSLVWDEGFRTLENALRALDEAGAAGADLACLPEECVYQAAEPIPGPAAEAIARKAAQYKMYVVVTTGEKEGPRAGGP